MKRAKILITVTDEDIWNRKADEVVSKRFKFHDAARKDKEFILRPKDRNIALEPVMTNYNNPICHKSAQIIDDAELEFVKIMSIIEQKGQQTSEIIDPAFEFEIFKKQYKEEVQEIYLLNQISMAIETITSKQKKCSLLDKLIDGATWAQSQFEANSKIYLEFNNHLKILRTSYNENILFEDWDTLKYLLRHLTREQLENVYQMILLNK